MDLIFLGTGGAWSLPELNCKCRVCKEMRLRGERRRRTSFLSSGNTNLLIDCGPDVASQLSEHQIKGVDAVLITHEHGDHYMGLDELFSYKRTCPRGDFKPIPVYITRKGWDVVGIRFGYLTEMGVLEVHEIKPDTSYAFKAFEFLPFKTNHGSFATGSVGYIIKTRDRNGTEIRLVYTSDFVDVPESPRELFHPDYLIIQTFWFNEPVKNTPQHMSFQRALAFIKLWQPKKETFLVHIGDGDILPGDPANSMMKKNEPANPLRSPQDGAPYPIPLNQEEWQKTVNQIIFDFQLPFKITVARDDLILPI